MIDTGFIVSSNEEAKELVINYLSDTLKISKDAIKDAITDVSTNTKYEDGEDIYIVHKKTKSNKDKLLYVFFAHWMV